jgi:hypothetical protein
MGVSVSLPTNELLNGHHALTVPPAFSMRRVVLFSMRRVVLFEK